MIGQKTDKQALVEWEDFVASIRNSTPVDLSETPEQKAARMRHLEAEGNEEEWIAYYFPKYAFAKPAQFQIESSKRVFRATRMYQRRAWARGLSKSTRRMMEVFYKIFAQKFKANCLLVSKSQENAIRLLAPYKANLEGNDRLINDYGIQEKPGTWTIDEFITRGGIAFRAVGAGQNPRGSRIEERRINLIIFDDVDDDEVCNNPDRLQARWDWIQRAVIFTVEVSKPYFIFFDNNIIAEDSIAVRAADFCTPGDCELVNIRDENGASTWPEKNSEEDIDALLAKVSYESGRTEYFNDPMSQGKTFPDIHWGVCPPISSLPYVLHYADPGTSNQDKPKAKDKANNSAKGVVQLGSDGDKIYIYDCILDNMNQAKFVAGYYELWRQARQAKAKAIYNHIENNTLQNPFYEQVLLPLIYNYGKAVRDILPITPDTRQKPEKWVRIEARLEPLNRAGRLIFNIAKKENPHMKRLESQFKNAKPTAKMLDGPDMVEGGTCIIQEKTAVKAVGGIQIYRRKPNPKRY